MNAETFCLFAVGLSLCVYISILKFYLYCVGLRLSIKILLGISLIVSVVVSLLFIEFTKDFFIFEYYSFYFCGVAVIVFLYGAVVKSLSIEMGILAIKSVSNEVHIDILAVQITRKAFRDRIKILIEQGLVQSLDTGYICSKKGSEFVRKIAIIRTFLRINGPGLY